MWVCLLFSGVLLPSRQSPPGRETGMCRLRSCRDSAYPGPRVSVFHGKDNPSYSGHSNLLGLLKLTSTRQTDAHKHKAPPPGSVKTLKRETGD